MMTVKQIEYILGERGQPTNSWITLNESDISFTSLQLLSGAYIKNAEGLSQLYFDTVNEVLMVRYLKPETESSSSEGMLFPCEVFYPKYNLIKYYEVETENGRMTKDYGYVANFCSFSKLAGFYTNRKGCNRA